MGRGRPRKSGGSSGRIAGGVPACPKFLSDVARKKWRDLTKQLKQTGLLSHVDVDTIARYCAAYATWFKANDMVQKAGEIYLGPNKGLVQNPWLSVRKAASAEMQKISPQLGLDPLSRRHLEIEAAAQAADDKARFFGKREGQK